MTTPTITRLLEIDAGHRLLQHKGKCRNAHGHRYRFEVTCRGDLDDVGRVIDFARVKELVGGWLDENWDHGFIVQVHDPLIEFLRADGSKLFILSKPPTAENLADFMHDRAARLLTSEGIEVVNVRCWETPSCFADSGAP